MGRPGEKAKPATGTRGGGADKKAAERAKEIERLKRRVLGDDDLAGVAGGAGTPAVKPTSVTHQEKSCSGAKGCSGK